MNEEIKRKWVEALRSGEYEQGKFCLRNSGSYCCLGVLLDVTEPERWSETGGGFFVHQSEDRHINYPSTYFEHRTGLSRNLSIRLAKLNDEGKTFAEIADIIEAEA